MKIIIVGGGISGLSTALWFRKTFAQDTQQYDIKIFEKHVSKENFSSTGELGEGHGDSYTLDELSSSTALLGGGLGVSPNGMRILKELGQELHDNVVEQGFSVEKFVFRSWRGWRLTTSSAGDGWDSEEFCVASSRHGIWKCLLEEVGEGIVQFKKIVRVIGRADEI